MLGTSVAGYRVEVRNLIAIRGGQAALDDLSITLEAGGHYGLMGPSGSGKTTLLHCLAGLVRPDGGEIVVGVEDISRQKDRDLRRWRLRHVGMVFQFGDLIPELTLRENIELPSRLLGCATSDVVRAAAELMETVGITDVGNALPSHVSGGQQQRAAVARAVLHRPSIILADEPTGAIDSRNGEQVMNVLTQVATEVGATLVVVTHDANVGAQLERALLLKDGRLVA